NDLDIPTLDVLEESLLEFPGALVLVTHDRYLLDRVSTQILSLDGQGNAEYFSDYAQWEANALSAGDAARETRGKENKNAGEVARAPRSARKSKLGYMEQRELATMEENVLAAEERLDAARVASDDPTIASDAAALQRRFAELAAAQDAVDRLYARWAELETKG
ncbi:MAG: ABC transporter ATP-binding protein, partial [Thermoanaerobaculia bacterium]